jgi:hypothetical protein
MTRRALAAPTHLRRLAPEPSLAMPDMKDRMDKNGLMTAAELGGALSVDWSLERLLDRLEGRR